MTHKILSKLFILTHWNITYRNLNLLLKQQCTEWLTCKWLFAVFAKVAWIKGHKSFGAFPNTNHARFVKESVKSAPTFPTTEAIETFGTIRHDGFTLWKKGCDFKLLVFIIIYFLKKLFSTIIASKSLEIALWIAQNMSVLTGQCWKHLRFSL